MIEAQVTRRGFLAAVAAGTAVAWLSAHASELEAAGAIAAADTGERWLALTAEQAAMLDAVTAQLVPTDDLPGAREAKVVRFIDRAVAGFMKDDGVEFMKALDELTQATAQRPPGGATFVSLSDADQVAVLTEFEKAHKDSFEGIRAFTILGMFADPSYGGNYRKAGWKMLGFEDRFFWTAPFGYYDRV